MILIADSGSTKCDWVSLDSNGKVILKTSTSGLNPAILNAIELKNRILENNELAKIANDVNSVEFYGAGCGTEFTKKSVTRILAKIFLNAKILVKEDIAAAVYAVTNKPGIVCILGTGSNSCYFDGQHIHSPISSLGYVVMDEASGSYFGKNLLRDFYYNKMPSEIALEFAKDFDLDPDTIKNNLYKKPKPNAYLASFAKFIFSQDHITPYFYELLKEGITNFINYRILSFEKAKAVPIHFVGSIAYFSKDIIVDCFKEHHLILGKIVQKPIDGLIEYYQNNLHQK